MRAVLLIIAALIIFPPVKNTGGLFARQGAGSVIEKPGICYSVRGGEKGLLDLYLPAGEGTSRPGVLLIHGGGWRGGDRGQWAELAGVLALRGFVCASASYRLAPDVQMSGIITDVRLAMDFFKSHAAEYGMDKNRIGAVGSSAGGHLAALLGMIAPGDRLGDPDLTLVHDTRPRAVACYNPVLDFLTESLIWPHQLIVFRRGPEQGETIYGQASPARRISAQAPPFLFLYGTLDTLTPEENSREMISRLAACGVAVEVAMFRGMEHGFGYRLRGPEQKRAAQVVANFFERMLE